MLILAVDTSGEVCSVAIADGDRVRTTYAFRHERHLSERLHFVIDFVLQDAGYKLHDVEGFAVGLGPGSFTGVRIGVTLAKTFALVRDKPIVGVSSLSALVETVAKIVSVPVVAVVPTRRTESIAAFYRLGETAPVAPPAVYANETLIAAAQEVLATDRILLLGEAAQTVWGIEQNPLVQTALAYPDAGAVARLAARRLLQGEQDDTDTLVPLYVAATPVG